MPRTTEPSKRGSSLPEGPPPERPLGFYKFSLPETVTFSPGPGKGKTDREIRPWNKRVILNLGPRSADQESPVPRRQSTRGTGHPGKGRLPAIERAVLLRGPPFPFKENGGSHTADIPASGSSAASPRGRRKKQRGQAKSHHLPGQLLSWTHEVARRGKDALTSLQAGGGTCLRVPGRPLPLTGHPGQPAARLGCRS